MAAQLKPLIWQEKTLSLDRTAFFDIPSHYHGKSSNIQLNNNSVSFLHSQKLRASLLESKKAFLNESLQDDKQEEVQMEEKSIVLQENQRITPQRIQNDEHRKVPSKKISFKIKKTSSIYRRNGPVPQKMTISANTVAELTKKFNQIIVENRTFLDDGKIKKLVAKRVNSDSERLKVTRTDSTKVTRKPSLKTKNAEKQFKIVKTKPLITRPKPKTSGDNKYCVRAKISYLESPHAIAKVEEKPARPTTLDLKSDPNEVKSFTNVRATIEIFERKTTLSPPTESVPKLMPKPMVPHKSLKLSPTASVPENEEQIDKTDFDDVEVINIPAVLPQRRCDSMYETLNLKKIVPENIKAKSEETISTMNCFIKPNTSFLWRKSPDSAKHSPIVDSGKEEQIYDTVGARKNENIEEEKIYEELNTKEHDYEYCETVKYEDVVQKTTTDDGYEYFESPTKENIYETLPPLPSRRQLQEPLPPRPPSGSSYCTVQNVGNVSNCYESIYNPDSNVIKKDLDVESNYESIYGCNIRGTGSNRDSLVSSDQQSNSLYGRWGEQSSIYNGKAASDLSSSDKSDEWIDVTDTEEGNNKPSSVIILREKQKPKKGEWSQHFREQLSKARKAAQDAGVDSSDSDHHYESLFVSHDPDDDYDSFDSDTESERSFNKANLNDSGVDIANNQLPEPPNNQTYVLTRIAATAGKHMRKLRRNWSLTKNDISKSLSRMTKRKSRIDLEQFAAKRGPDSPAADSNDSQSYQNVEETQDSPVTEAEKTKSLPKKGFLNKFRRSMSLSAETASELTTNLGTKPTSTFYLTETIDVDEVEKAEEACPDSGVSLSPTPRHSTKNIVRPQSPPPPAPQQTVDGDAKKVNRKDRRASSWYAEAGLFKSTENRQPKRPNTFWYAEVGLYQENSTISNSSTENSGNASTISAKKSDFINTDNSEEYYNMKNESSDYYNESIGSLSSQETKKLDTGSHLSQDIQLRLQDEPLYQFYDAAVLESVCHDGTSDFDSDGYEEVCNKRNAELRLSLRPSAMELVSPKRNSIAFNRTLWCEIPEVIQSSVLSTLSTHQKKLQEAKFEIITSEASYLNSLNVLNDYLVANVRNCDSVQEEEFDILFGKINAVRDCSARLLQDLEKCWQENILLYGVCDIIQKHAEDNFHVYVSYCENQILLDATLKRIKERSAFSEILKQFESNAVCQSLTLYSFLMLPMQRVTRWPLLVDAVLKRLSDQDPEFLMCQIALATLNKTVSQCNEAARRKERENELKMISTQLEFPKGVQPIEIVLPNRWLIRSGSVIHMQQRTDETKLTFGKRFTKSQLHIFLFNDMLFVTKSKSENTYTVLHYCLRNLVELNSADTLISLPIKDSQGRNLLFMTLLENQDDKTVEFLMSCNSESDKERWTEALTPPKSEDPDETLYECWDCPQVTSIHNYVASQPDELALARGDVINVLRKMADGWYHGERIRDGECGWFPANYTVEIANPHVRSRNLKQRYRLLAFSENYLKNK